jgi:PhoH-like ATPase
LPKHIYIIDTCVLLHDPLAIYKFSENDIYIPLAVIDDLDDIKTRRDTVGWSAREVFRQLENYSLQDLMKGVKVNEKGGKLFVYNTEAPPLKNERPNIVKIHSDNAIIEACLAIKAANPKKKVSIVTKDTGLRIRAITWGCEAENYRADLLADATFTGIRHVPVDDSKDWSTLWGDTEVPVTSLSEALQSSIKDAVPNEFIVFESGSQACPAYHKKGVLKILKDKSNGTEKSKPVYMGISPKNLEQRCAIEALADRDVHLVTLCGAAGTGKTMLTLAVALHQVNEGVYDKIIVIKPMIAVGGKDIGFLPGDKFEKINAWLGPIRDNIEQLVGGRTLSGVNPFEEMVNEGMIEVEAMAFIQGRSIPKAVVIVDESQNLTPREARMVVERCGKDSKIVLLGDLSQVENAYLDARSNGLAHAIQGGKSSELAASVTLTKVERSSLAAVASEIFKRPEARR